MFKAIDCVPFYALHQTNTCNTRTNSLCLYIGSESLMKDNKMITRYCSSERQVFPVPREYIVASGVAVPGSEPSSSSITGSPDRAWQDEMKHTDREVAARQTGASLSWVLEISLTPTSHSPASRAPGVCSKPLNPFFPSICCLCTLAYFWEKSTEGELLEKRRKFTFLGWSDHSIGQRCDVRGRGQPPAHPARPTAVCRRSWKGLWQKTMINLKRRHPSWENRITEQFSSSLSYQLFDKNMLKRGIHHRSNADVKILTGWGISAKKFPCIVTNAVCFLRWNSVNSSLMHIVVPRQQKVFLTLTHTPISKCLYCHEKKQWPF